MRGRGVGVNRHALNTLRIRGVSFERGDTIESGPLADMELLVPSMGLRRMRVKDQHGPERSARCPRGETEGGPKACPSDLRAGESPGRSSQGGDWKSWLYSVGGVREEVKDMCPWVDTLGFCPFEAASKVWQWVQSLVR